MELYKLTADELKGYDAAKLRETEKDIRRELVNIRMDIYTAPAQHTGKIRGLRKSLARLLTVKGAKGTALVLPAATTEAKAPVAKTAAKAKPAATTKTATKK